MTKSTETYNKFVSRLSEYGLNLHASFQIESLPEIVRKTLPDDLAEHFSSLLLVGNKGGSFWRYLKSVDKHNGHCFDQVSQELVKDELLNSYPGVESLILYPNSQFAVPLQQLGHLAGWGRPSVLGLDIHPQYGTWFAYRVAIAVTESLPLSEFLSVENVCESCVEKPCRVACPAGAVNGIGDFDLNACLNNRLKENSVCADRCLARLACPIGLSFKYQSDQIRHHGGYSLSSIKRYMENAK